MALIWDYCAFGFQDIERRQRLWNNQLAYSACLWIMALEG